MQFRGGPAGFLKVLDANDDRLRRLPRQRAVHQRRQPDARRPDRADPDGLCAPAATETAGAARGSWTCATTPALVEQLEVPSYRARVERAVVITVEAFDWNCPQHITPRYTLAQVEAATQPLRDRIADLEARLAATATG